MNRIILAFAALVGQATAFAPAVAPRPATQLQASKFDAGAKAAASLAASLALAGAVLTPDAAFAATAAPAGGVCAAAPDSEVCRQSTQVKAKAAATHHACEEARLPSHPRQQEREASSRKPKRRPKKKVRISVVGPPLRRRRAKKKVREDWSYCAGLVGNRSQVALLELHHGPPSTETPSSRRVVMPCVPEELARSSA